jgi:DNA-binding winged helix-turn-helix (wHTH) protein
MNAYTRAIAVDKEAHLGQTGALPERIISFGPFCLLPMQRLLLEGDKSLRLGSRALDILITLVDRPGELVSKEELMARVWPNTFVDPANLTVHVAALRRALGDGRGGNRYLINVPGRGYCFVGPVFLAGEQILPKQPIANTGVHNLPVRVTRLVGRAEIAPSLATLVSQKRFLTIVGPSGIGRTSVALSVAELLIAALEDGVWLINLARLSDSLLGPNALASALGVKVCSDHPIPGLIACLRNKQMLLVFDSCEHAVDDTTALVEGIMRSAPDVWILATSLEPLHAEGEQIHRLPSLG